MQNHLQYPQPYANQGPNSMPSHQKFTSPTHSKVFDKTMPVSNAKHYASNPNISLDFNNPKASSGST